jgi:hypothetical protein
LGNRYDTGINPAITINNRNEVVAVHQVPNESLLHYRRGIVNGGVIEFSDSRRYDNYAEHPAVALLDSGLVIEAHSKGGLITRIGRLSPANRWEIEWSEPIKQIGDHPDTWGRPAWFVNNPSLGISGNEVLINYDIARWLGFVPITSELCSAGFTLQCVPPVHSFAGLLRINK